MQGPLTDEEAERIREFLNQLDEDELKLLRKSYSQFLTQFGGKRE